MEPNENNNSEWMKRVKVSATGEGRGTFDRIQIKRFLIMKKRAAGRRAATGNYTMKGKPNMKLAMQWRQPAKKKECQIDH